MFWTQFRWPNTLVYLSTLVAASFLWFQNPEEVIAFKTLSNTHSEPTTHHTPQFPQNFPRFPSVVICSLAGSFWQKMFQGFITRVSTPAGLRRQKFLFVDRRQWGHELQEVNQGMKTSAATLKKYITKTSTTQLALRNCLLWDRVLIWCW